MSRKQPEIAERLVSLSVRVPESTATALKERADANYRPVATHIRWLIDQDLLREERAA